jgi:hypothetical protein
VHIELMLERGQLNADPLSALGDELKGLLAAQRWGVDALARRVGLGRTVVSRALNGREVPTSSRLMTKRLPSSGGSSTNSSREPA